MKKAAFTVIGIAAITIVMCWTVHECLHEPVFEPTPEQREAALGISAE
jgi:hypothetical protein